MWIHLHRDHLAHVTGHISRLWMFVWLFPIHLGEIVWRNTTLLDVLDLVFVDPPIIGCVEV